MSKKIAIMGSDRGNNFSAIVEYFKNSGVEITCLSDNLNSDILKCAEKLGVKHQYRPFEETAGYLGANDFDLIVLSDYKKELTEEILELGRFVNVHPSLLPAFKGADAVQRAYFAGVKVSGVTVHRVVDEPEGYKIIAQYPVLIGNDMHFDEFEAEIHNLENLLYPIVIDKLLKDEVFDFGDLISGCHGNCKGCSHS